MGLTGAPHKRTILIAEGQPLLREYLPRLLLDPGYQLLSASDGNDAISIAANLTQHLDLLVTDSQVGSITGFQIGDRLLQENPGAKVLMISTISVLESAALRRGFEFLRKPFGRVAFMSRVRELLQGDTERSRQPGLVIPFRTMPPTGTEGNRRKGKAPTLSPQRRAG